MRDFKKEYEDFVRSDAPDFWDNICGKLSSRDDFHWEKEDGLMSDTDKNVNTAGDGDSREDEKVVGIDKKKKKPAFGLSRKLAIAACVCLICGTGGYVFVSSRLAMQPARSAGSSIANGSSAGTTDGAAMDSPFFEGSADGGARGDDGGFFDDLSSSGTGTSDGGVIENAMEDTAKRADDSFFGDTSSDGAVREDSFDAGIAADVADTVDDEDIADGDYKAPEDGSGVGGTTDGFWQYLLHPHVAEEEEEYPDPPMPVDPDDEEDDDYDDYDYDDDDYEYSKYGKHRYEEAQANRLTASVWDDNSEWPFFTNLVLNGHVSFPQYGLQPGIRIEVTVKADGEPLENEPVSLHLANKDVIWKARTNKDGVAYLFYSAAEFPETDNLGLLTIPYGIKTCFVSCRDEWYTITDKAQDYPMPETDGNDTVPYYAVDIDLPDGQGEEPENIMRGLQVMFIMDTTGSMGDELEFLKKDFGSIATEAAKWDGEMEYSVNFYRDEGDDYVTLCHSFTDDADEIVQTLDSEIATGGGDTPEALDAILTETLSRNPEWSKDMRKLVFLIFDAPPHDTETVKRKIDSAVKAASSQGIHIVPILGSTPDREAELFGRALSIMTDGTYVFLTDDSGVGGSHMMPIIGPHKVENLHNIILRIIREYQSGIAGDVQ